MAETPAARPCDPREQVPALAAPEQILGALDPLWRSAGPLLRQPLSDRERRRLGGRLFESDFLIVQAVGAMLCRAAALFSDVIVSGPELLARQRRADAYRQARDQLLYLARLANDGFLEEQGTAVIEAMSVIQTLRRSAQAGPDTPQRRARHLALVPVLSLLDF